MKARSTCCVFTNYKISFSSIHHECLSAKLLPIGWEFYTGSIHIFRHGSFQKLPALSLNHQYSPQTINSKHPQEPYDRSIEENIQSETANATKLTTNNSITDCSPNPHVYKLIKTHEHIDKSLFNEKIQPLAGNNAHLQR